MAASSIKALEATFLIWCFFISMLSFTAYSVEFDVGGSKNGWVVPPPNQKDLLNLWAANNTFRINDTLRFTYKDDIILWVQPEDYQNCRTNHPVFFDNSGDTIFLIDRPGLLYFISGVLGNCDKGLRVVVNVLEPPKAAAPPLPPSQNNEAVPPPPQSVLAPPPSSGASLSAAATYPVVMVFALSMFSVIVM